MDSDEYPLKRFKLRNTRWSVSRRFPDGGHGCCPFVRVPAFFEARARGTIARGTVTATIRAATRQLVPLFPGSVNVSRYFQIERSARRPELHSRFISISPIDEMDVCIRDEPGNSPFERNGQIAECFARQTRRGVDRSAIKLMATGNFVRTIFGTTVLSSPSPTSPFYELVRLELDPWFRYHR